MKRYQQGVLSSPEESLMKKTKLNSVETSVTDNEFLYDVKTIMSCPFPANIRNNISNAGIHHSGISWVLDNDKLYVWNVKKYLLESDNSPALCLENVPLSESSDKCFVSILRSNDETLSVFTCSPQGKFKYWYELNLRSDEPRFKYEIGSILDLTSFSSDGKLNINCIENSLSSENNIYIGTECGHFIDLELLSNGAINVTKEKKVYGNQNTSSASNEGLFEWFTSWTKPTTIKYFEPEALLSIQSSKSDLLILTEKCISKYTEQGKDLCWRKDISNELQNLNMIRNHLLKLLDFSFDEQSGTIYLLTCRVPSDNAKTNSTIEFILWPIQITDQIVVESPVLLDKTDFNENYSKMYSKCQIVKSLNRIYISTLNTITVIEDNKIILQSEYNGIVSLGNLIIDGLDTFVIDRSGNLKALKIVKLEENMSQLSNSINESINQTSVSDETTLANEVLGSFRKHAKITSLNFVRSSIFGPSIVKASQMLVDSIPTSGSLIIDAETIYYDKLSILILRSLQNKMTEYMEFLQYLVDYQYIGSLAEEDLRMILQNGEKLFVCIKLRELQNQIGSKTSQDLIIQAMNLCCEEEKFAKSQCNVENFFIFVSKVENLIHQIQSITHPEKIVLGKTNYNVISVVNQVLLCFSEGIMDFRKTLTRFETNIQECGSTWTIDKPEIIVNRFFEQFETSASNLSASESNTVPQVLNQMYEIADFIFFILQTMKEKEVSHYKTFNFEVKRDLIIGTFRKMKDVREISPKTFALTLAEKYRDFKHLIQIAEENYPNEKERAVKYSQYVKRYKDFAKYLFTYLRDSKKYHELLANNWSTKCGEQLASVIETNPNLKWLHYIQVDNLPEVESSLADLSDEYSQNILPLGELGTTRNRLSLLKLASVANNSINTANSASYFLKLTYYQAQLATDLAIEEPIQNWSNENYKGAVDLLISIYKGIPSENRVIMENQRKLYDRLLIATDIYCDFYEKETEVDEQTKLDILLNIYTSSFYVSVQLLHLIKEANSGNEESMIRDSILYKIINNNKEKKSKLTPILKEKLLTFLNSTFSERHAEVVQSVFDLIE